MRGVLFEVSPVTNLYFYGRQLQTAVYESLCDSICICTDDQNKYPEGGSLKDAFACLRGAGVSERAIAIMTANSERV